MRKYGLLAVLVLGGCGMTAAQQRVESIQNGVNSAQLSHNSCIDALRADPVLADFSSRYPEYESSAPSSQLDSPAMVTEDIRPVFAEAHRRVIACRQAYRRAMDAAYPEAGAVVAAEMAAIDRDWSAMVSGQITIGQAIRRANERDHQYQAQMAYVNNQVGANLQARHATELQNRATAAAALSAAAVGMAAVAQAHQQAYQQQQLINAINRPVITNCNRFGSSVSCTSW